MIEAELHGKFKLAEISHLEDNLTSNVFGLLKFLPFGIGLKPWLATALNRERASALDYWLALGHEIPDDSFPLYSFWPAYEKSGVPDVLVSLRSASGEILYLLVEAKYGAGKSNRDEADDQLFRYLSAMSVESLDDRPPRGENPQDVLVYVTADRVRPVSDLTTSERKLGVEAPRLFWTSWAHLWKPLQGTAVVALQPERLILSDLSRLLRHKGFVPFEGWGTIADVDLSQDVAFYERQTEESTWEEILEDLTIEELENVRYYRPD